MSDNTFYTFGQLIGYKGNGYQAIEIAKGVKC